jgi:hypothetical protein
MITISGIASLISGTLELDQLDDLRLLVFNL